MYNFQSNSSINKLKNMSVTYCHRKGISFLPFFWSTSDTNEYVTQKLSTRDSCARLEGGAGLHGTEQCCDTRWDLRRNNHLSTSCRASFPLPFPSKQSRGTLAGPRALPTLPLALLYSQCCQHRSDHTALFPKRMSVPQLSLISLFSSQTAF